MLSGRMNLFFITSLDVQAILLYNFIFLIIEALFFVLLLGDAAYMPSACFLPFSSVKLRRLGRHSG